MSSELELPGLGHNNPPQTAMDLPIARRPDAPEPEASAKEPEKIDPAINPEAFRQAKAKLDEFNETAKAWQALKKIETEAQAGHLDDFIAGARKVFKVIDGLRVTAKKPHDEAAQKVQDAFKPMTDAIERMVKVVTPLGVAWKQEQARIAEADRLARKRAAEAEAAAAAAALEAAKAANDIAAQVEAENAAKAAAKEEKAADRPVKLASPSQSGARGVVLRRVVVAEIETPRLAFAHFKDAPEMAELLIRMALTEARAVGVDAVAAGHEIPGFKLRIEERA